MPRSAIEQGAMPETEIEVRGWTAGKRGLLEVVLNQRDRLGSQLQTVDLEADGSLTLRTAALGLVPLVAVPILAYQVIRRADDPPALVPFMGLNVAIVLVTPLLLAVGLMIA